MGQGLQRAVNAARATQGKPLCRGCETQLPPDFSVYQEDL